MLPRNASEASSLAVKIDDVSLLLGVSVVWVVTSSLGIRIRYSKARGVLVSESPQDTATKGQEIRDAERSRMPNNNAFEASTGGESINVCKE